MVCWKNLDYNVDRQSSAAVGCFRDMLHRFVNFTDINNRNQRKQINNDTGKNKLHLGTSSPQRPHQGLAIQWNPESYLHCMLHPCCQKPSNPATFFFKWQTKPSKNTYESHPLSHICIAVFFGNKPERFFSQTTPAREWRERLHPGRFNPTQTYTNHLRAEVCEDHQQFLRLCLWIFGQFLPPDCHTTHGAGGCRGLQFSMTCLFGGMVEHGFMIKPFHLDLLGYSKFWNYVRLCRKKVQKNRCS